MRNVSESYLYLCPEKEMWKAGYKYSIRKMEAAAQNRAQDGE